MCDGGDGGTGGDAGIGVDDALDGPGAEAAAGVPGGIGTDGAGMGLGGYTDAQSQAVTQGLGHAIGANNVAGQSLGFSNPVTGNPVSIGSLAMSALGGPIGVVGALGGLANAMGAVPGTSNEPGVEGVTGAGNNNSGYSGGLLGPGLIDVNKPQPLLLGPNQAYNRFGVPMAVGQNYRRV